MIFFKIFTFILFLIALLILFLKNLPADKTLSLYKKIDLMEKELEEEIRREENDKAKNHLISFAMNFPATSKNSFTKIQLKNVNGEYLFSLYKGYFKKKTIILSKDLWFAIENKILEIDFEELGNSCDEYEKQQNEFLENHKITKKDKNLLKKELNSIKHIFYKIHTKEYFDINYIPVKIIKGLPASEKASKYFDVLFEFSANLLLLINKIGEKSNNIAGHL